MGKGDRNCGQGTRRGDDDHDDNRSVEGRLSSFFECEFHAQKLRQKGKLHQKSQRVCWRKALVQEEGTRGDAAGKAKVTAMALPWFLSESKNLVVS